MGRHIVFVGEFKFPEGDASANRVLNIAKAMRDMGDEVHIIGTGIPRIHDKVKAGYSFQGFAYETINTKRRSMFCKVLNLLTRSFYAAARVKRIHQQKRIDVVVVAVGYARFVGPLLRLSRKMGFKLVIDVVEWYDPGHLPFGKWGPFNWDVQLGLRWLFKKAKNIIAISTLLEDYYTDARCNVARIPPMIDMKDGKWEIDSTKRSREKIRIIYAGTPGAKDLLPEIIKGIYVMQDQRNRVELQIFGSDIDNVRLLMGSEAYILDELGECVQVFGRVEHTRVVEAIKQSDFSVLLRPDKRYANAGFPTKVVESLAAGTPVLINYTSDLELYIKDGLEGLIVEDWSAKGLCITLKRAINLSENQLYDMRQFARKQAEECFDYRVYIPSLNNFLNSLF